jgi:hypothetical protein
MNNGMGDVPLEAALAGVRDRPPVERSTRVGDVELPEPKVANSVDRGERVVGAHRASARQRLANRDLKQFANWKNFGNMS